MNVKKKQCVTDKINFGEMCRVRGIEEESPGIQWKSQLCNLNILTVGFASLPSVFPRWDSLRRVYHTLSRWRALGRTLMGADLCC